MTGGSMTKAELVEEVSRVSDLTKKHSEVIVDTVFKSIIDALHRGEKIELRGFGSFRLRKREPRKGRNPKTGDKVDVPPKKVPYFKPGKELKELINGNEPSPADGTAPTRRRRDSAQRAHCLSGAALVAVEACVRDRRRRPVSDCIFCDTSHDPAREELILARGRLSYVILNLYPYNNGHLMVVPVRHVASLALTTAEERSELMALHAAGRDGAHRGVLTARNQRRNQPRAFGRRRRGRPPPCPPGAALDRRH